MSDHTIFDRFRNQFPFAQDKWEEYVGYYHRTEVPAKTILLREGEISRKAFVIEKGCLRVWFNHKGKDITFQFFFENEAVSSAESFMKSTPSMFSIEAIEPSVVHWIYRHDMEKILDDITRHPDAARQMMNGVFERQFHYMKQFLSFIRDTPAERYLRLIEEQPEVLRRVPQQYIASYLGITPVSLSRIRAKLK